MYVIKTRFAFLINHLFRELTFLSINFLINQLYLSLAQLLATFKTFHLVYNKIHSNFSGTNYRLWWFWLKRNLIFINYHISLDSPFQKVLYRIPHTFLLSYTEHCTIAPSVNNFYNIFCFFQHHLETLQHFWG